MVNLKRLMILSTVLAVLVMALPIHPSAVAAQEGATVGLRFVHALADVGTVDVYVENNLVVAGAEFGDATPHLRLPVGIYTVSLRSAGASADEAPLYSQTLALGEQRENVKQTAIIQPNANNQPSIVLSEDDLNPARLGQARLHAVHAIAGVGPIDIRTQNGAPIAEGITFNVPFGTVNPPVNTWDLVVVASGGTPDQALVDLGTVHINTGLLYKFIVAGTADAPTVIRLTTPLNADPTVDTVLTRIAHGSPDAPAVDIYANDVKIFVGLEPGAVTEHVALPAGDVTLAVRPAGEAASTPATTTANVNISSSTGAASLVAVGALADNSFTFSIYEDNVANLPNNIARVRIINTVTTGSATVRLAESDLTLAEDLSVYAASDPVDVEVGIYTLVANVSGEGGDVAFELPSYPFIGGQFYTVLLYANASAGVSVKATTLNADISSLPGAVINEPLAVFVPETPDIDPNASTSPPVTDTTEVAEDTSQPSTTEDTVDNTNTTDAAAPAPATDTTVSESSVPAGLSPATNTGTAATEAPPATTTTNTAPVSPPPAAPPQQGLDRTLRGQVNLNPGVNLQCREYPSPEARSLGLVPNNTLLEIVGYAAAADPEVTIPYIPVAPELAEVYNSLPRTTENEEGVKIPGEYDDLEFSDIWLSALWNSPDGNIIDCWVRADFLILTYQDKFIRTVDEFFGLELFDFFVPVIRPVPYNYAAAPVDVETTVLSPSTTVTQPTTTTSGVPVTDARAIPILGIVNVVGNGNLQCREYPSPQARSLGLIPNGTQLQVVGYAGPADPEITTPFIPVEADDIVVFESLPPETDAELNALDFTDVWLSALFTPESGNTLDCWVRADFLTLTYRDRIISDLGALFALDNPEDVFDIFRPVPYNDPASIVDSRVAPSTTTTTTTNPPAATTGGQITGVITIPANTNLNLYEEPSFNSLLIRAIGNGTAVTVIGRTSDNQWLNIRYEALGEGTFIGWVSNAGNWVQLSGDINTVPVVR
ncbi:MAG: hypothetical protein CUN55_07395 [Phototrophicales bacterium]|nr:MAG: hypothetical protein CUN55_07395 [Phototrophicales bacterium]